ncbi:MAG: hypothetical protein WCK89_16235 [bacterium]
MSKARGMVCGLLCVCAAAVLGQETGAVTRAGQAALNRAVMKAAAPAARIGANGVKPVIAQAVRLAGAAAVPALTAKAGYAADRLPAVAPVSAKAVSVPDRLPAVSAVTAAAWNVPKVIPAVPPVRLAAAGYAVSASGSVVPVIAAQSWMKPATYVFVFAERGDVPLLYPEIESRRAVDSSHFGYLEYQIALACKAGDTALADELVRQYVNKWDEVYKPGQSSTHSRRSAGSARPPGGPNR